MTKTILTALAALALGSSMAVAGGHSGAATNGKGEGKGKTMAAIVSAGGGTEKGGASAASGLKGGWGGRADLPADQVSSGPSADFK